MKKVSQFYFRVKELDKNENFTQKDYISVLDILEKYEHLLEDKKDFSEFLFSDRTNRIFTLKNKGKLIIDIQYK